MNLDILIYVFITIGFFEGILRGVKKEFFTLISLLGAFACVLFACIPLYNLIDGPLANGVLVSFYNIDIVKKIFDILGIGKDGFVYLVVGGTLFLITYLVLAILFKKIFFSTKKAASGKAREGSRFLGGIVGLVSGFVLALFFIPFFEGGNLATTSTLVEILKNEIPFLSEKLVELSRLTVD